MAKPLKVDSFEPDSFEPDSFEADPTPDAVLPPTPPVPRSALGQVLGGAWSNLNPLPAIQRLTLPAKPGDTFQEGSLPGLPIPTGPANMVADVVKAHVGEGSKAWELAKRGRYSEAAMHGFGAMLPMYGPPLARLGDTIRDTSTLSDAQLLPDEQRHTPGYADAAGQAIGLALPFGAGKLLSPVTNALPRRLYQSGLKVPQTLVKGNPAKLRGMVDVGLQEGIPIGSSGGAKAQSLIESIENEVRPVIAAGAAAGKVVDPVTVAGYVTRSLNKFANQVNRSADMQAIGETGQQFLNENPGPIPVDRAQAIKSGTYTQLKDKYGKLSTASIEAQKDLAYGLKEEVYKQFPELRALGAKEGALVDLNKALERYAFRHGNRDIFGIGTPIVGTGLKAAGASHPLVAAGMMAKMAATVPAISSRIAIGLNRAGRIPGGPALSGLGAIGSSLPPRTGGDQFNPYIPQFARGGIVGGGLPPSVGAGLDFGGAPAELPPIPEGPPIPANAMHYDKLPASTPEMTDTNRDLVHGSSDIPLNQLGQNHAIEIAHLLRGKASKIYSSDLGRASTTANSISSTNPQAGPPLISAGLRPWHLGSLEGQPAGTVIEQIKQYATALPDQPLPGRGSASTSDGESFNDFKQRSLSAMRQMMNEYSDQLDTGKRPVTVAVTHYRDLRALKAWADSGFAPDFSINPADISKHDATDDPANIHRLYRDKDGSYAIEAFTKDDPKLAEKELDHGIYIVRSGQTELTGA